MDITRSFALRLLIKLKGLDYRGVRRTGRGSRGLAKARRVWLTNSRPERPARLHVSSTDINTSWARAPAQVRFPPHTFRFTTAGRIARSPSQLVGSTSGWLRNVNHSSQCFRKCADSVSEAGTSRAGRTRSLRRRSNSWRACRNCSADTAPFLYRLRRWIASVNNAINFRG